ncbi:glycosyltransferase family 4 protein [Mucilaginibacter agri]|uniref:Glycosyltransferase n=1 Tax=Mucilaginibacter agri TaxID=2695265 RepID=A0A965ZJC0_9SPHI|nr:glycosyltransferase family 4 protein [Mucilaginibacter agri]NCD70741.1 glycosyltransferase [Mucilaginibacter agri]
MKILILLGDITKRGGTERTTCVLSSILATLNYEVFIISFSSSNEDTPFYSFGDEIYIKHLNLPSIPIKITKKPRWYLSAYKNLQKQVSLLSPQLIISTGHNFNTILPFVKSKQKIRIIGCEHWDFSNLPRSTRFLMKLSYKYLDALVVLTDAAREKVKGLNKNTVVIPNALPFLSDRISALDSKRILLVGRLSQEKGYERLVPIAKHLKIKYPDWHIDIFGEGELETYLTGLFKENEVDDYITINSPIKNIENEYLKSSIYLMVSHNEAMPMVILEAKSCGVPIIAYYCEGTGALIKEEKDGFIIQNKNQNGIVEKLSLLIQNEKLRAEIGANARRNALEYSTENIGKKWKAVIDSFQSR